MGWIGSPVSLPYTRDNPDIQTTRHAVSIDERRAFFRTNLFAVPEGRDIKQIWFAGVHCDVGGGYKEEESGLSKIALKWMIEEAEESELLLDPMLKSNILGGDEPRFAKPNTTSKMHESLTWKWWPAEFVPKRYYERRTNSETWRVSFFRRRNLGERPVLHDSVWQIPNYRFIPSDAVRASASFQSNSLSKVL